MKSLAKPVRDGGAEGRTGDWGEVVTRYPYENVGMDHLLSKEIKILYILTFINSSIYFLFSFERLNLSFVL